MEAKVCLDSWHTVLSSAFWFKHGWKTGRSNTVCTSPFTFSSVHTCLHLIFHTCLHLFTPVHTYSHLLTPVRTCSPVIHTTLEQLFSSSCRLFDTRLRRCCRRATLLTRRRQCVSFGVCRRSSSSTMIQPVTTSYRSRTRSR